MGENSSGSNKGYEFGVLSQPVIGAATRVHRELGAGFLEYTHHKALAVELRLAGIDFQHEVDIPIYYRDEVLDVRRADFVVGALILELKAVEQLIPEHAAQLAMYLKAARFKLGLVLNFGASRLQVRRVVN